MTRLTDGVTWSLRLDDSLGRDAHAPVVQRQLAAGQVVGPAVVVAPHHRLAARLGPLAHALARLDGLVLEVDGADGRVHGAQEEEQVGAAAGTLAGEESSRNEAQEWREISRLLGWPIFSYGDCVLLRCSS